MSHRIQQAETKKQREESKMQEKTGYVERNLLPGERVIYKANIHWFIFFPSVFLLSIGIVLFTTRHMSIASSIIGMAIFIFITTAIAKISTEFAVTSKRVIVKKGLISRTTIELNHNKVESINVHQSILGRIFGFGTLVVNGTGGGKTTILSVDSPLEFN